MPTLEGHSGSQLELFEDGTGPTKSLGARIHVEAGGEAALVGPGEVDVIEPGPKRPLGVAQQDLE